MMLKSPKLLKWYYPSRIWGISASIQSIALTFDDGPDKEITPWVLAFLKEQNIKATFFCVGTNVQKHPEIYAQIIADGHSVGNHTMNHENGFKTKDTHYIRSIENTSKHVESRLFRPPYGRMRKSAEKALLKQYKIIMWSWLSYDYDENVSIRRILQHSKRITSGDILVFHDNQKTKDRLKNILPTVVQNIKNQQLEFVVLTKEIIEN